MPMPQACTITYASGKSRLNADCQLVRDVMLAVSVPHLTVGHSRYRSACELAYRTSEPTSPSGRAADVLIWCNARLTCVYVVSKAISRTGSEHAGSTSSSKRVCGYVQVKTMAESLA